MKSIPNPISLMNEENLEIIYVETDEGTKRYAREKGSIGTFKRYKTLKEIEWELEIRDRRMKIQIAAIEQSLALFDEVEEIEEEKPKRYGYPKKKKKGWFR